MDMQKTFDEHHLTDMMFDSESVDTFKSLWDENKDAEKWGYLLHMCYWEISYERAGGDEGYLDNPPINVKRIKYLEELIDFLEKLGIQAINDAPQVK